MRREDRLPVRRQTRDQSPEQHASPVVEVLGRVEDRDNVIDRLNDVRRQLVQDFNTFTGIMLERRADIREVLDWRLSWGERNAHDLPEYRKRRGRSSASAMEAVASNIDAMLLQARAIENMLTALIDLEAAALAVTANRYDRLDDMR